MVLYVTLFHNYIISGHVLQPAKTPVGRTTAHIEGWNAMEAYQPLKGNVIAEYQTDSGAVVYVMDTFLCDTSDEALRAREEQTRTEVCRILQRQLQQKR